VLARVGKSAITVAEVERLLGEQPVFVRSRYDSPERKRAFVEQIVRSKLLVEEARAQGLDRDPEVEAMVERLLVQRLLQKHATETESAAIPEEELQKYYQEHFHDFVRPERMRVSHLLVAGQEDSKDGRSPVNEAARLLVVLRQREASGDSGAFAELARAHSVDATSRDRGGDLGFRSRDELAAAWGQAVAKAADELSAPGDVRQVVGERGVHLLRVASRQPGVHQTFEQARQRIESRLQVERRSRAVDDLIERLRKSTPVELDEKVLAGITVPTEKVVGAGAQAPLPLPSTK